MAVAIAPGTGSPVSVEGPTNQDSDSSQGNASAFRVERIEFSRATREAVKTNLRIGKNTQRLLVGKATKKK
jgi:hypothetical protein